MKEYIDRNELYDIESLLMTDIIKNNPVANNLLEQVLFDIKESPVADVREIVHAKWEMVLDDFEDGYGEREYPFCSNCHSGVYIHDAKNYCPNCGAKMIKDFIKL